MNADDKKKIVEAFQTTRWSTLDEREELDAKLADALKNISYYGESGESKKCWDELVGLIEQKCGRSIDEMLRFVRVEEIAGRCIHFYFYDSPPGGDHENTRKRVGALLKRLDRGQVSTASWFSDEAGWLAVPMEELEELFSAVPSPLALTTPPPVFLPSMPEAEAIATAAAALGESRIDSAGHVGLFGTEETPAMSQLGAVVEEVEPAQTRPSAPADDAVQLDLNDYSVERVAKMFGWADAPSGMEIVRECLRMAEFLVGKNRKYGDSALRPMRVFSKTVPSEGIRIRMDDKLSRLVKGDKKNEDEDVIKDLVGYYMLLQIAEQREAATRENEPTGLSGAFDKAVEEVVAHFDKAVEEVVAHFDDDQAPHATKIFENFAKAITESVDFGIVFPYQAFQAAAPRLRAMDTEDLAGIADIVSETYATKAASKKEAESRILLFTSLVDPLSALVIDEKDVPEGFDLTQLEKAAARNDVAAAYVAACKDALGCVMSDLSNMVPDEERDATVAGLCRGYTRIAFEADVETLETILKEYRKPAEGLSTVEHARRLLYPTSTDERFADDARDAPLEVDVDSELPYHIPLIP